MTYKRRDYTFEQRCCELADARVATYALKPQPTPTVSKWSWASLKDYVRVLLTR